MVAVLLTIVVVVAGMTERQEQADETLLDAKVAR